MVQENKTNDVVTNYPMPCIPSFLAIPHANEHTIVKVNHSDIAVLLQDNIWDGNTVDPYVKST